MIQRCRDTLMRDITMSMPPFSLGDWAQDDSLRSNGDMHMPCADAATLRLPCRLLPSDAVRFMRAYVYASAVRHADMALLRCFADIDAIHVYAITCLITRHISLRRRHITLIRC